MDVEILLEGNEALRQTHILKELLKAAPGVTAVGSGSRETKAGGTALPDRTGAMSSQVTQILVSVLSSAALGSALTAYFKSRTVKMKMTISCGEWKKTIDIDNPSDEQADVLVEKFIQEFPAISAGGVEDEDSGPVR
ncbi:hypothetical protein [Streptomyces avermitilis]|uniref:hypothetical protein n=1 Tax=Streptomyces avermitilis TaxID=33903 RepID=UPI003809A38C